MQLTTYSITLAFILFLSDIPFFDLLSLHYFAAAVYRFDTWYMVSLMSNFNDIAFGYLIWKLSYIQKTLFCLLSAYL